MGAWPLRKLDEEQRQREALVDLRFRALVGRDAWDALPEAVRRRFSKRLSGEAVGALSRTGGADRVLDGWLAVRARPAPDRRATAAQPRCRRSGGGQRQRGCAQQAARCGAGSTAAATGFPQVIHSAKRFAGPTGLEEYVGRGVGMALKVEAMADGLRFVSDHYFLMLAGGGCRLPRWIEPGRTIVEHHDLGHGCFLFSLMLRIRARHAGRAACAVPRCLTSFPCGSCWSAQAACSARGWPSGWCSSRGWR